MPRGVREPVQEHERALAAVDDELQARYGEGMRGSTGMTRRLYRDNDEFRRFAFESGLATKLAEWNALFGLTPQVRRLSEGVSTSDLSSQAALPPMFSLLEQVSWPSDFAVFELGWMMIRESTHSFSPFSVHRSMVGRGRSLVRSALGRAVLTAAAPALRREMLEISASLVPEDAELARDRGFVNRFVSRTRSDGYASSVGETEQGISAIAVPIGGIGPVLGSLNIVFFSSAMTPQVAAKRYLHSMRQAARDIERRWRAAQGSRPDRTDKVRKPRAPA
jgi:IclR family mhp operon transcriptional activator